MTDSVAQLADAIATLQAENEALDKAVAEATEQRKAEHSEYVENLNMNNVAVHLVKKAKNALQKVYQPSLHKAALLQKPRVISAAERVLTAGISLVEVSAVTKRDSRVAPPEAPETFSGSVKPNKGSAGVLGMMTRIIDDLDLQIQEVEHDEKTAQKDYAELMADSQTKRAETSKIITSKEAAKAVLETKLETEKESHRDA